METTQLVLHLTENPAAAQLLQSQLDEEPAGAEVRRIDGERGLVAALAQRDFDLLVVDLPLPSEDLERTLSRAQAEDPELAVVFRWNTGGAWHWADGSEPLSNIVRQTLHLRALQPQDVGERQRMLARVVRGQEAFLRLTQTDFSDFEQALRRTTETVAELLDVERVSVWELAGPSDRLHCLDLFERTRAVHSSGHELVEHPRYSAALASSLMIAAHDALRDARTSEFREGYLAPLGITSMLDAPIRRRGEVRGVVCFEHVGPRRTWDVLEQCHAASTANVIAGGIEARDRRALEDRLNESERLRSIAQLSARLAHEFNNRLTALRGGIELTLDRTGGDLADWEAVLSEVQKASETARRLMDLDRHHDQAPPPVDLGAVLRALRPTLERLLGRGIRLRVEVEAAPLRVAIEPADFEQVLLHLATNARDALEGEGTVDVSLAACERRAVLTFRDDGPGMDDETRRHAFEPLASSKGPDVGLGLASVFAVVQGAGGDVRLESRPGDGTRVLVELPLGSPA